MMYCSMLLFVAVAVPVTLAADCCLNGTFGLSCQYQCHCQDPKEPCNVHDGECHTGCAVGWEGPNCAIGNMAMGKRATQQSTYQNNIAKFGANNAIEGTFGNNVSASQCSKTNNVLNAWWTVDLGAEHVILDVTIFGSSQAAYSMKNLLVTVSEDGESQKNCSFLKEKTVKDERAIYVFDCEDKPLKARFVTVKSLNRKQSLVLCEVKVRGYLWTWCKPGTFGPNCPWSCDCAVQIDNCDDMGKCNNGCRAGVYGPFCKDGNVILEKNASQSSTYSNKYRAEEAVDGSTLGYIGRTSTCSHTNYDRNAWWMVDIGYSVHIKTIYIYNRRVPEWYYWWSDDQSPGRLRNIEARVGNDGVYFASNPLCNKMVRKGKNGEKVELQCPSYPEGRYVSIHVIGRKEFLTLCEVEVDASSLLTCPDQMYGLNCEHVCGRCLGGDPCHKLTGKCPRGCLKGYSTCQGESSCLNPGGVANGTSSMIGNGITYQCNRGFYIASGSSYRSCKENGAWTGKAPVCKSLSCGNPGKIVGSKLSASSYNYGGLVSYEVLPGYTKETGNDNLTCGSDAKWQGTKPTFSRIKCVYPHAVENAQENGKYFYGDVVEFSCYDGYYRSSGDNSIKCGADGHWIGTQPICSEMEKLWIPVQKQWSFWILLCCFIGMILGAGYVVQRRNSTLYIRSCSVKSTSMSHENPLFSDTILDKSDN